MSSSSSAECPDHKDVCQTEVLLYCAPGWPLCPVQVQLNALITRKWCAQWQLTAVSSDVMSLSCSLLASC